MLIIVNNYIIIPLMALLARTPTTCIYVIISVKNHWGEKHPNDNHRPWCITFLFAKKFQFKNSLIIRYPSFSKISAFNIVFLDFKF